MQGFNMGRYVPPELEGTVSANKVAGKHPLGSRARHASSGILTVRFEMPFPIWCTTCPRETIIGQGVRFNAEKKKTGNYYSSPIFTFRMKHTPCGGFIEIRTDPKTTQYVVVSGARKRDLGEDRVAEGDIEIKSAEEKEKLRGDAFAALEVTIEDRAQESADKSRIGELKESVDRGWEDPYERNQALRRAFREGRKRREKEAARTEELSERMGLGIELLPESEEDEIAAGFVDFGEGVEEKEERIFREMNGKGIFAGEVKEVRPEKKNGKKKLKAEEKKETTRRRLQQELGVNTRSSLNPFLSKQHAINRTLLGVKRKRDPQKGATEDSDQIQSEDSARASAALVDYGSD